MRLGALVGLVWLVGCGGNSEGDLPEDPMEPTAGESAVAGSSSEPMAGKGGGATAGSGGSASPSGGKSGTGGTSPAGGRAGASGSAGADRGGMSSTAGESGSGGQPGAGMGGTDAGSAGMVALGGTGGTGGESTSGTGGGGGACAEGEIRCSGSCQLPVPDCDACEAGENPDDDGCFWNCGAPCVAGMTCQASVSGSPAFQAVCADELSPFASPDCHGFTTYRVPVGSCLVIRGRFVTRASDDCQPSAESGCGAMDNAGVCPAASEWGCDGEYTVVAIKAAEGRAFSVERHDDLICAALCTAD